MKNWKKIVAFCLAAVLLGTVISCAVMAASPLNHTDVYGVTAISGYTLIPLDKEGNAVTPTTDSVKGVSVTMYPATEKFSLSFLSSADTYYLVFMLSGDNPVPTKDNIVYMDQVVGKAGQQVSFLLYPMSLSAETYNIYIAAGNGSGMQKVAGFKTNHTYTLGDVNSDGRIETVDALIALKGAVGLTNLTTDQRAAADVDKDGDVKTIDALLILKHAVGLIKEFPS